MLVLDLSGVAFFSAVALACLIDARDRSAGEVSLRLVVPRRIRRSLQWVGMEPLFRFFTVVEALPAAVTLRVPSDTGDVWLRVTRSATVGAFRGAVSDVAALHTRVVAGEDGIDAACQPQKCPRIYRRHRPARG
ncbi:anti-sigma factor antagonist [Amycolatopsis sp. FDAARGOS 1241]|nr:anti-sigma factor antagonist [Amycolatopsis sp. FDAARGOS 1241]QRP42885.1 anti-sigma factor antagonist [Amycolatopsis sp. FDAARGOS 1241]